MKNRRSEFLEQIQELGLATEIQSVKDVKVDKDDPVQVRLAGKRHMESVLEIENRSFNVPWDEPKFLQYVQKRNHIFKVVESRRGLVYGFIIYELAEGKIRIVNLAVAPEVRRTGIGSMIVEELKDRASPNKRPIIEVYLLERNIQAQLFFSSLGFRAVSQKRAEDICYDEDLYLFQYSLVHQGVNRISRYFKET